MKGQDETPRPAELDDEHARPPAPVAAAEPSTDPLALAAATTTDLDVLRRIASAAVGVLAASFTSTTEAQFDAIRGLSRAVNELR